jgi:hypothetical protein
VEKPWLLSVEVMLGLLVVVKRCPPVAVTLDLPEEARQWLREEAMLCLLEEETQDLQEGERQWLLLEEAMLDHLAAEKQCHQVEVTHDLPDEARPCHLVEVMQILQAVEWVLPQAEVMQILQAVEWVLPQAEELPLR